MYFNIKS